MSESLDYQSHLSREAVTFVVGLSKKKQRRVLDLADQIARQPFQISDYQTVDADGRTIENLKIDGYLFSFWVDHASREVRISDIVRL